MTHLGLQSISACVAVQSRMSYTRGMEIRDATIEDAELACEVTRRSIIELCIADHKNDVAILTLWLSNKTPENFTAWISHPSNAFLLAIEKGGVVGVGALTNVGEITLNYVSPDARFSGVSKALLAALEGRARQHGNLRCTLISTETAHRFYRDNGYIDDATGSSKFGASGHPMCKILAR